MTVAADPCQLAEQLTSQFRAEEDKLRHARRRLSELQLRVEQQLPLQDRRQLAEAKASAQQEYHRVVSGTSDAGARQAAATVWLNEINRLNREAFRVSREGHDTADQLTRAERFVHRLEMEVDAHRIRAESARDACNELRRAAASAAELEDARRPTPRLDSATAQEPPIAVLLRGDRAALQAVAAKLAEATEQDAGRLQLMLIQLCEQIAGNALDAVAISFAAEHPFWSQFEPEDARLLAGTLAQVGYRFDGRDGWLDELAPQPRHIALALAHSGLDGHVRRLPTTAEIGRLWQGAQLESIRHLARRAPDLSLAQLQEMLGARSATLDDLWQHWAEARRLLLN